MGGRKSCPNIQIASYPELPKGPGQELVLTASKASGKKRETARECGSLHGGCPHTWLYPLARCWQRRSRAQALTEQEYMWVVLVILDNIYWAHTVCQALCWVLCVYSFNCQEKGAFSANQENKWRLPRMACFSTSSWVSGSSSVCDLGVSLHSCESQVSYLNAGAINPGSIHHTK